MKYTVIMTPRAEADLTDLWLTANDQADLSLVADAIDRQLKHDPNGVGATLYESVRRYRIASLVVDFEVNDDDCVVNVLRFHRNK